MITVIYFLLRALSGATHVAGEGGGKQGNFHVVTVTMERNKTNETLVRNVTTNRNVYLTILYKKKKTYFTHYFFEKQSRYVIILIFFPHYPSHTRHVNQVDM